MYVGELVQYELLTTTRMYGFEEATFRHTREMLLVLHSAAQAFCAGTEITHGFPIHTFFFFLRNREPQSDIESQCTFLSLIVATEFLASEI